MLPYKIALADDHVMFREMTRKSIKEIPGIEVSAAVSDGVELLDLLKKDLPDMVILDITMPNLNGIDAIKTIKRVYPKIKILVLTMHKSKELVYAALSAGADGYLLKENAYSDLIYAIEKIRSGDNYISNLLTGQMVKLLRESETPQGSEPLEPLSTREHEILKMIAEGKSPKEIAQDLSISLMTVYNHRVNIKKKLGVRKEADLIKYAIQKGYSSIEE